MPTFDAIFCPNFKPSHRYLLCASLALLGLTQQAQAGSVLAVLTDKLGNPVMDGVIYATPIGIAPPTAQPNELTTLNISQENYLFLPYVSVLRVGSSLRFSNRDPHDHHIKSFSLAKSIDLRIGAKKEDSNLITLDKTGEIALVCYFHDWMRGFVYVVDTPYFAKTDQAGNALLANLPAGNYEVKAWVPKLIGEALTQTLQVNASDASALKFKLSFTPVAPPKAVLPRKKTETPASAYEYTR